MDWTTCSPTDEQVMFDLAFDREQRREKQGYVTPRRLARFSRCRGSFGSGTTPRRPAIPSPARISGPSNGRRRRTRDSGVAPFAGGIRRDVRPRRTPPMRSPPSSMCSVEAGVLPQQPRALLDGPQGQAPRLARIQAHMQFAGDRDHAAYSMRSQELAYLANTIVAGCSIQARPFTAQEASDAAVAVCNLGLENWPPHWIAAARRCPTTFSSVTIWSACSRSGGRSSTTTSACTRRSN